MKLATEITRNGWTHTQVDRNGDFAIYMRTLDGTRKHFEVIRIQKTKKEHTWPNGKVTLAGTESYPGDQSWGRNGWTYMSLHAAVQKFEQLTQTNL